MRFAALCALLLLVNIVHGAVRPVGNPRHDGPGDGKFTHDEELFQILLSVKNIDTRRDSPVEYIPKNENESNLYLVHHTPLFSAVGPEHQEFIEVLMKDFNTKLYGPVPRNSYYVYATQAAIEFIKSQEKFFDWVSYVDPEWRRDLNLRQPQKVELSEEDMKETKVLTSLLVSLVPTSHDDFKRVAAGLEKDMRILLNAEHVQVEHQSGPYIKVNANDEESLIRVAEHLANIPFVQFIERSIHYVPRLKFVKPLVLNGIQVTSTTVDGYYDGTYSGSLFTDFVPLSGYGQIIGVADTGLTSPTHCFLYSFVEASGSGISATNWNGSPQANVTTLVHPRIKQYYGYNHGTVGDETGHGTYVATIMSANPPTTFSEPNQYRGLAYQAKLAVMDLTAPATSTISVPNNLQDMYNIAYLAGARVYCNSFSGYDPTKISTGFGEGAYSTQTGNIDAFMYNNQDMLIVVPAGFSKCVNASSSLGTLGWSKNALVVGASMNVDAAFNYINTKLPGVVTISSASQTSFVQAALKTPYSLSNKSPAPLFSDGRMKPDIYAPGTLIIAGNSRSISDSSCANSYNPFGPVADTYFDMLTHGPSYSAAIVSGLAALVREYLTNGYQNNGASDATKAFAKPSASLVKAILINGAIPLPASAADAGRFAHDETTSCPMYNSKVSNANIGFGYAQLSTSLLSSQSGWKMFFPGHTEGSSGFGDPQILQGVTQSYQYCAFYSAAHNFQINITLAWMDPPPTSGASNALLNNLDLKVVYGTDTYYGNGKSSGDTVNTVERVQLPALDSTVSKKQITINVIAGTSLTYGKQNYSLVITGWISAGNCASALTPDGQNQSVVYTDAPTKAPCTSFVCQLTSDSNTYIAAIILLITLILVCCVCCCLAVFFVLSIFYSPMRKKAKGTSADSAPIVSTHPYGSEPEIQRPTVAATSTASDPAPAPPAPASPKPSGDDE